MPNIKHLIFNNFPINILYYALNEEENEQKFIRNRFKSLSVNDINIVCFTLIGG